MKILTLIWEFFKTGLFSIGGGLSTLPFLKNISLKYGWYTLEDLGNIVAISESTPGPLGINAATYTGFITSGIIGGVVATLSLVTPSIIIILVISKLLEKFSNSIVVKDALHTLRAVSVALISSSLFSLCVLAFYKSGESIITSLNFKGLALAVVVLFLSNFKYTKKLHPIVFILFSALMGLIFKM